MMKHYRKGIKGTYNLIKLGFSRSRKKSPIPSSPRWASQNFIRIILQSLLIGTLLLAGCSRSPVSPVEAPNLPSTDGDQNPTPTYSKTCQWYWTDTGLTCLDPTITPTPPKETPTLPFDLQAALATYTPTPYLNCTYPQAYWQNNPDAWTTDNITVESLAYTKDQALAVLNDQASSTRTRILQQLLVSVLNISRGADASAIQLDIHLALQWLGNHASGETLSLKDEANAKSLADTLEAFNVGKTGPGLCPDAPSTATPAPSSTATSTPTPTPTATRVIKLPSYSSPTPTKAPEEEKPKPTKAPQPTSPPPTEPPPTRPPTQPTEPPPTEPPQATPTSPPAEPPVFALP
jgi:hypothetical protein